MRRIGVLALLTASWGLAAEPQFFSVPGVDAPELAPRGSFAVGVRTQTLVHRAQPDVLQPGAPATDRSLPVGIWYPAKLDAGVVEQTTYTVTFPTGQIYRVDGKAARDAKPLDRQRFPLVIVSHGYPGSRFFLSYLTENLASKGYVVAAIDHTDSVAGQVRGFSSTLLNRAADQLFAIAELSSLSNVDNTKVAIVGYSMGGYGAMLAAGAGLSPSTGLLRGVPDNRLSAWVATNDAYRALPHAAIKAVVAIAPWGNQPPYNGWSAESEAGLQQPLLMIAGDHDDVAEYEHGIRPLFDHLSNRERYLLVYKEARHNTGGNPPPPEAERDLKTWEHFAEPVWRKERITAINQHFITAFLDVELKGDESHRVFLEPPAAPSKEHPWPGFQPRWWLGLEWIAVRK